MRTQLSDTVRDGRPIDTRMPGSGAEIRFAIGECSLGMVLIASSGRSVCAVLLGDDHEALLRDLRSRFPRARLVAADTGASELVARVVACIETPGRTLDLPLDMRGTAFQQRVWQALRTIPVGATASYADIARRIGAPGAARAVAAACAANALAVVVPCHRVVGKNGALSGYRWGAERKRRLLARETNAA